MNANHQAAYRLRKKIDSARINFWISRAAHARLRSLAAEKNTSMRKVLEQVLEQA